MNKKAKYEAPALTCVGTFEDITQGGGPGTRLDATFPNGTPDSKLTFDGFS
jgi:hypothetical protein